MENSKVHIKCEGNDYTIDDNGAFNGHVTHAYDEGFSKFIINFFKGRTVIDFGCGGGEYVRELKKTIPYVEGWDGNPHTEEETGGLCKYADLSQPFISSKFDWVVSLEVGEHIPKESEQQFIDNLCEHAQQGILLSWAPPSQLGEGHINCQEGSYLIEEIYKRGFLVDMVKTNEIRSNCETWWFQRNLLVFYKVDNIIF